MPAAVPERVIDGRIRAGVRKIQDGPPRAAGGAGTRKTGRAAHAGCTEGMVAGPFPPYPASVVCAAQEKDRRRLLITRDGDGPGNVVDQAVDGITGAEDAAPAPNPEPVPVHVSEPESRPPAGAKAVLKG